MPVVSLEELGSLLAQRAPAAGIVLLGGDSYLRETCRQRIVEAFVPEGARDWAVTRLAAREAGWDEILQRARTVPMLAPRQVILVEGAESVERLGDEARDEIVEALEEYFASPAPFTVLVLEAAELDGRLRFYKLLASKAVIVELEVSPESAVLLAARMAKQFGVEMDREAAALLAEIVNYEPARIHMELEKLAAYVQGRGRIARAEVEALVVSARKNTVWQFADMLADRNRAGALALLDNLLREGEQPPVIVGALAWTYRKLIEARELPPQANPFQASRQLGMRGEAAATALRIARRVPMRDLLAGLAALAQADSAFKSSNPDARATMEFLVARLTQPV